MLLLAACAAASAATPAPPTLARKQAGSLIEAVTIDTHGVTTPAAVSQYLTMRSGSRLTQSGVDRDYANLRYLAGYIPVLTIDGGSAPDSVRLHWDVAAKPLTFGARPYYNDRPLAPAFPGAGIVLDSPPVDARGANFLLNANAGPYADRVMSAFVMPLHVDARSGAQSDVLAAFSGARGVYRQPTPPNNNIYSWQDEYEIDYWRHDANDTQFEIGVHHLKSTSQFPNGIISPSIYPAWRSPSRNTLLEAGILHGCRLGAALHPPYCSFQYRAQIDDAVGLFATTSHYQLYSAAAATYARVGSSVFAAQLQMFRSGGVLPDSLLVCSAARAYSKAFCGTDAQLLQAEYRIAGATARPLKFTLFFDDAASRIRDQIAPVRSSNFQWHSDAGVGVTYRNAVTLDLAYGSEGGRLTFAFAGESF